MISDKFRPLQERMRLITQTEAAGNLAQFHLMTGGASSASESAWGGLATKAAVDGHRLFVEPETSDLIDQALESDQPAERQTADFLRQLFVREQRVPAEVVARKAKAGNDGSNKHAAARNGNDFPAGLALLRESLAASIELGAAIAESTDPAAVYTALLQNHDLGLSLDVVTSAFQPVKDRLPGMVKEFSGKPQPSTACLRLPQPELKIRFFQLLGEKFGYTPERGRFHFGDTHPMSMTLLPDDGHIFLRRSNNLCEEVLTLMHEAGHGIVNYHLHEVLQGWSPSSMSLVLHESMSQVLEKVLVRTREFWEYLLPVARGFFPELGFVSTDQWWRAMNAVQPGLIRVHADELCYPLHIALRQELEYALISGDLQPQDLPGAWNEKMQAYFGLTPPDFTSGCLQDIHWFAGYFGYFPTYTLGAMQSVQWFNYVLRLNPNMMADMAAGDFSALMDFLAREIHPLMLVSHMGHFPQEVIGEEFSSAPWFAFMEQRYNAVYGQ